MVKILITLFGGLAFFLYGMKLLSDGLKKLSSQSIKNILEKVTASPLSGTLVGVAVTSLIQSSSATTVLAVGFVNSGLMNLSQVIGIIYGANIGTTVTAQIMAFKIDELAIPLVIIGAALNMFAGKEKTRDLGAFMMGFGLLFFGMLMMKEGINPIKNSPEIVNAFIKFSEYPFLGVVAGTVITMILQSSSATVGLVLALVSTGMLNIYSAIPIILGDNIGTCITAALASIGCNITAKRTAAAHFGFNMIGTIYTMLLMPFYIKLILLTSSEPMRQAANAHTIFNVMNTIVFLPFTKYYTRLIEFLFRGKTVVKPTRAIYLDKNLVGTPPIAFKAVVKELSRALDYTLENLSIIEEYLKESKGVKLEILYENENILDNIQQDITVYIAKMAGLDLTDTESAMVPKLLHATNDIERIGDHGQNFYNLISKLSSNKLKFSEKYRNELLDFIRDIREYTLFITGSINEDKYIETHISYSYERKINVMRDAYKNNYIEIMKNETNGTFLGSIYYDFILNFEKVGDHLTNISQALAEPA